MTSSHGKALKVQMFLTNFDGENHFEKAKAAAAHQPQWVCRAATGSDATNSSQLQHAQGNRHMRQLHHHNLLQALNE